MSTFSSTTRWFRLLGHAVILRSVSVSKIDNSKLRYGSSAMRKVGSVRRIALMVLCAGFWASCADSTVQEQMEVREQFLKAVALVQQAQQGFVPKGQEVKLTANKAGASHATGAQSADSPYAPVLSADLRAYRQGVLAQAVQILEPLLNRGTNQQKANTKRLLSEILTSQVNETTEQAISAWADLASHAANLVNYKASIDHDQARIRLLAGGDDPLLAQLRQDQDRHHQQISSIQSQASSLRAQIQDNTAKIETLTSESHEQLQKAERLRNDAFSSHGDMQYEMYDQAAATQRHGENAAAEAQQLKAHRDLLTRQLAAEEIRLREAENALAAAREQVAQTEQRQRQRVQEREKTQAAQRTVLSKLDRDFKQFTTRYAETVDQPLDAASQQVQRAVKLVKDAVAMTRQDKRSVQLELLARMTQQAAVLSDYILITGSHDHLLAALFDRTPRSAVGGGNLVTVTSSELGAKHRELIESAVGVIEEAVGLAEQLRSGVADQDPYAARVSEQVDVLDRYRKQIKMIQSGSDASSNNVTATDAAPTWQAPPEPQHPEMRPSNVPMK